MRALLTATCLLLAPLVLLAPLAAAGGNFQIFEDSLGAPGQSATYSQGSALVADIDFDADSAEGGGLLIGATEIEIRPTGSVVFVDFTCALPGCFAGVDYLFTPGDAQSGAVVIVSDDAVQEKHGIHDLGSVEFDAPGAGSIELIDCNYTGTDQVERTCDAFTLATLPEPQRASGLAAGGALLAGLARRVRRSRVDAYA